MPLRLRSWGVLLTGLAVFVIFAYSGCVPEILSGYKFTSADRSMRSWGLPGVLMAADGAGGGTEGEAVPRTVVEPDVIRRDGQWLYILNQFRGLTIVDLHQNTIVANLPTIGFPRDIYIQNGRAYVLVSRANRYEVSGNTVRFTVGSRLYIADITDPTHAQLLSSFDLAGDLIDSRLVGDVLYAVGAEVNWYYVVGEPGVAEGSPGGRVVKTRTGGTWVTSVNCADPNNIFVADEISFDDTGTQIHATPDAIFVSSPNWGSNNTSITYVDISDPNGSMAVRGSANVKGQVVDRFKLDYWNGVLRVISLAWNNTRKTYVTTIACTNPDALAILAEYEFQRAQGETLFATRFDGDRAYIVTYFIVDPLFILDLSDPTSPAVTGELEVPGWSTHIEPRGDRLIALGVDDTGGSRRVCVSLFDVADPAQPDLADRVTFGTSWNWSSAYDDVKSLAIFDDTIVVPFSGWEEGYGTGFNRLQFISYTRDDLTLRGFVDVNGTVLRTFQYQGLYYCVTTEQLVTIDASDLDNPVVVNHLVLAENVSDFLEITPTVGAEIVSQAESGKTSVHLKSLAKTTLGTIDVDVGYVVDSFVYNTNVVLVGQKWEPDYHYLVVMIDCSVPSSPEIVATIPVDVDPYVPWWFDYEGPVVLGGPAMRDAKMMVYPWRVAAPGAAYLAGDKLALRCSASSYDNRVGTETSPSQGLAIVDLTQKRWTRTIGLGFGDVVSINAVGQYLYVTNKKSAGNPSLQPLCAYFITRIDPSTGNDGASANVPGVFVQYNPSSQILTLRDDQWSTFFSLKTVLRTVSWDGVSENVSPIASLDVPDGTNQILGRGSKIYLDAYTDGGYRLYLVQQSAAGGLILGTGILCTDQWGTLIDAHSTAAYVSVGDGAIVKYNCSGSSPQFSQLVEVMGAPMRIRFGSAHAYAPLGYFGTAELPL